MAPEDPELFVYMKSRVPKVSSDLNIFATAFEFIHNELRPIKSTESYQMRDLLNFCHGNAIAFQKSRSKICLVENFYDLDLKII